jgi:hypothetical protein
MMGSRDSFSTKCVCGEELKAQTREGLSSILRAHVLVEHAKRLVASKAA